MAMIERDKLYLTQANGKTVMVLAIEIEQRLGKNRGKWVCRNQYTGRKIHRTARQLRNLHDTPSF